MGIEDLKRWHWTLIGAVLGLALAYVWVSMGETDERVRRASVADFERDLLLVDEKSGQPYVQDIVVRPPTRTQATTSGWVNVVTYKRLSRDRKGRLVLDDRYLYAEVPYKPALPGRVQPRPDLTIEQYLEELKAKGAPIRYRRGWWHEPKTAMMLGAGAGMLLLGGVWATLLNIMVGAGLGRPPQPQPTVRSSRRSLRQILRSWTRRADRAAPVPAKASVSAEQQQRLREVAEAYEQQLAEGAVGVATATDHAAASPAAATEARKFDAAPLEPVAPLKRADEDDEIEIKGEYYPVLIHHKKPHHKDQSHKDDQPHQDGTELGQT
ncbi:hypothetical protein [Fontivita pretiosa]|uniref:hypothetical protein n=1 Tax=Fontivita pretiosa TaxID=2989684 RepID=UPI003D186E02